MFKTTRRKDPKMKTVDVIGDCRARGLFVELFPKYEGLRRVEYSEECGLEELSLLVNTTIDPSAGETPPDLLVLRGGIYDIIDMRNHPQSINLHNLDIEYGSKSVRDKLEAVVESAHTVNSDVKIVVSMLYGADLNRMINKQGKHPLQRVLDTTVVEANKFLIDLNIKSHASTPFLERLCHTYKPVKGYRHDYTALEDGCHPASQARTATLIANCLNKMQLY